MERTALQFQVQSLGESFAEVLVPYPKPEPNEVCIRTRVVSLNPLDWKARCSGLLVDSWPAVLGIDAAGVVEVVGEAVSGLSIGDEVFTLGGFDGLGNRAGAFQEIITVPSHFVAKRPTSMSLEEAASLPICYLTAVAAVTYGLRIALPHLSLSGSARPESILVLGGSSCTGAAAIQLLRLALPSATILTTSSAEHHSHLKSLGATLCFERSAQEDPSTIKAATDESLGVDAILDAVGAAAEQPSVFTALRATGLRLYSQVATGAKVQVPTDVESLQVYGAMVFRNGVKSAMEILKVLIECEKYKLPVKVEVVGKGCEGINSGLIRLMKGVSGAKYVVNV